MIEVLCSARTLELMMSVNAERQQGPNFLVIYYVIPICIFVVLSMTGADFATLTEAGEDSHAALLQSRSAC